MDYTTIWYYDSGLIQLANHINMSFDPLVYDLDDHFSDEDEWTTPQPQKQKRAESQDKFRSGLMLTFLMNQYYYTMTMTTSPGGNAAAFSQSKR